MPPAPPSDLPERTFADVEELRAWLAENAERSSGLWVRLYKATSGVPSITFEDLLVEGLAHGWSESTRRAGDRDSYLQRFTPRRRIGTVSSRNARIVERLQAEGRMTRGRPAGPRSALTAHPAGATASVPRTADGGVPPGETRRTSTEEGTCGRTASR